MEIQKNKNIKIAIVSSSFPPFSHGGVSSSHYNLLLYMKKKSNFIVSGFSFYDFNNYHENDKILNIKRSGTPLLFNKIFRMIIYLYYKIFDNGKASYQTADILSNFIGSIITGFKILRFKPDVIIVPDHGAPMFFIKIFNRNAKYIWVSHHNPMRFIKNPLIGSFSEKDAIFATNIEKICIKDVHIVVCPSEYMKEIFKDTYKVNKEIRIIPNLVDIELLDEIKPGLNKDVNIFRIFIPSGGSIIKGERYIFPIMQLINFMLYKEYNFDKKIEFFISGIISEKLEYEIKNSNISCTMLGKREYKENLSILKSCDLTISPTVLESFGMALLESVMLGVPVVTFDVGGNREIIKNGENGYLVKFLDIIQFSIQASKLILNPLEKEKVRNFSRSYFHPDKIYKEWEAIIDELIKYSRKSNE